MNNATPSPATLPAVSPSTSVVTTQPVGPPSSSAPLPTVPLPTQSSTSKESRTKWTRHESYELLKLVRKHGRPAKEMVNQGLRDLHLHTNDTLEQTSHHIKSCLATNSTFLKAFQQKQLKLSVAERKKIGPERANAIEKAHADEQTSE